MRELTPGTGGGPMMPPSTNVSSAPSTTRPILRTVAGETAFASIKMPLKPWPATSRASASAPCGGHTDSTMSATPSARSSAPRSSSPAALARERVAALRPADAHTTRRPSPPRQAPIAEPISPGWSSATVFIAMGTPPGSMSRRDDLDMVAAHVEKGHGHELAVPELPDLGLGDRDEVPRLDHVVGHPRPGHQLDVTLDAIRSGQDGDLGLVGIRHSLAPRVGELSGWSLACASRRDGAL